MHLTVYECGRISKPWCTPIRRWRRVTPPPASRSTWRCCRRWSSLGCVPIADYGLPGTPALTEPMLPLIPKYDALLMANHGAVCYGEDVYKAYFRMETMEHFARIAIGGGAAGRPQGAAAAGSRQAAGCAHAYGVKARSAGEPGCPVAADDPGQGGESRFYVTRSRS
jgi:hypothetical protein